eukprot:c4432_g1_i1.p2 GENE.c4432_g1_i1~~c4432_g1_i1.p2  ORF type:complete len:115 (-),score=26.16 c4432_g1_i1:403-720(-)
MTKGASMSGASQAVRPASAGSARSGPPTKALAARRRIPSAGSAVAPTAKTNSVSAGLAGLFNSEDGAGLQLSVFDSFAWLSLSLSLYLLVLVCVCECECVVSHVT